MIKKILLLFCLFITITFSANILEDKIDNSIYEEESKSIEITSTSSKDSNEDNMDNNQELNNDDENNQTFKYFQKGEATFYGRRWNGRKTASGDRFDASKLTAAHKTLPFGTKVRVTNINNNKYVDVIVTDRGPYKKGRIIDLTEKAFSEIANLKSGVIKVKLEIINEKE